MHKYDIFLLIKIIKINKNLSVHKINIMFLSEINPKNGGIKKADNKELEYLWKLIY